VPEPDVPDHHVLADLGRALRRDDPRLARRLERGPYGPLRTFRTLSVLTSLLTALVIAAAAMAGPAPGLTIAAALLCVPACLAALGASIVLRTTKVLGSL
jgi:hypothetical protein